MPANRELPRRDTVNMKKFIASILAGLCVVLGILAIQPTVASGDDGVLLQEIRALREEIAKLRYELRTTQGASGVAQDTAQDAQDASNIISDLNSMRSASLMFFADNMDDVAAGRFPLNTNIVSYLTTYLTNPRRFSEDIYIFGIMDNGWWVGFNLESAGKRDGVRERLRSRARDSGLYSAPDPDADDYTDQDIVWMMTLQGW